MVSILVIDDDITTLSVFGALCKSINMQFIGLQNFEQLKLYVEMKLASDVDIILLDIKLPFTDGYEILTWLRANTPFTNTPIVAISAQHDELEKVKSHDFQGFITKPFRLEGLTTYLNQVINKNNRWFVLRN